MTRSALRRLVQADFDNLLSTLTARQYVHPHEPLAVTLQHAVSELGVCPEASKQALSWLQLDGGTPIGRLRRTELMQLARTLHRFWRERVPHAAQRQPQ